MPSLWTGASCRQPVLPGDWQKNKPQNKDKENTPAYHN